MESLIFLFGMVFVVSLQPVFMVSSLIFITMMYSYMIMRGLGSFWFSYVLLMVMLSGVLVVFTYVVIMTPNESFEVYNLIYVLLFIVMLMVGSNYFYVGDMSEISMSLWVSYLGSFSLFLVVFLLSIMLLVIVLSYMSEGAFRMVL